MPSLKTLSSRIPRQTNLSRLFQTGSVNCSHDRTLGAIWVRDSRSMRGLGSPGWACRHASPSASSYGTDADPVGCACCLWGREESAWYSRTQLPAAVSSPAPYVSIGRKDRKRDNSQPIPADTAIIRSLIPIPGSDYHPASRCRAGLRRLFPSTTPVRST